MAKKRKQRKKRTKRNTYGPCIFECGREAHFKESQTCKACMSRLRYWSTRGPRRLILRARQVASWQRSYDAVLGQSNVAKLPVKKTGTRG